MRQVPADQLVPGRQYRVEPIDGTRRWMFIGTFIENVLTVGRLDLLLFDKIISARGRAHDHEYVTSHDYNFYESGQSLVAEQTARGLSNRIPENVAGIVERMLTVKAPGRNRYPPRRKRKTRKNRRSHR